MALSRLSRVGSQICVMSLLIPAVVSRMIGLNLTILLLLSTVGIVYTCIHGIEVRGDSELALSRLSRVRTQISVVTLLVAAVISRMVRFWVLLLGELLLVRIGIEIAIKRRSLTYIAASILLLCWLLGIRTKVGIMTLLITTIVCCVIILRALEVGELVRVLVLLLLLITHVEGLIVLGLNHANRLVLCFKATILGCYVPGTHLRLKAILLKILIHNKNPP